MGLELDYVTFIDYEHSGSLSEDSTATSSTKTFRGSEGFVIDRVEIFPPFNGAGSLEELIVMLSIDGDEVSSLRLHSDLFPPYLRNVHNIGLPLGDPTSPNPFENTCLKGNKSIQVKVIGGRGGVTGDFRIKVKGYYVESDEALKRLMGNTFCPTPYEIYDKKRNIRVRIHKPLEVTIENLPRMCGGGVDAGTPKVMPFATFCYNASATTANQPFALDIAESNHVHKDWGNLSWDLKKGNAMFITHIAVRPHTNSKYFYWKVKSDEIPDTYFDIGYYSNELPWSTFADPRPIRQYPILFKEEKVHAYIVDNGSSIPAYGVRVFVFGKKIELGETPTAPAPAPAPTS